MIDWLRAVRVVAITDRRLMVAANVLADGDVAAIADAFGAAIARALDGVPRGAAIVQVREADLDGRALLALARAAIAAAHAAGQHVVVNDRVDVALAAGADGAHLPERGLAIDDARALLGDARVLGVSRHDRGGACAAIGADLVQLGPIWSTPSKTALGIAALGVDALAVRGELAASARLVAVGGIDSPARARDAFAAGADAIAVIRAAWTGGALAALADRAQS